MPHDEANIRSSISEMYGPGYYASHCGPIEYDRSNPIWMALFGSVADDIIRAFQPSSVFDAGCAHGFLVEALWDRGVEAYGRDISEYAISKVRPDIARYCSVGSLADKIPRKFDLITCIEVLEHLSEEEGMIAVRNLTESCDRILFSSSPSDFEEPTHFNVQPPLYWMKAFAQHGFEPEIARTFTSLPRHAFALVRAPEPPRANFLQACAEVIRCRIELGANDQLRNLVGNASRFDTQYYISNNSDVEKSQMDPLQHYVRYGRFEGRYPNPDIAKFIEPIVNSFDNQSRDI